jgi:hypothetical protein
MRFYKIIFGFCLLFAGVFTSSGQEVNWRCDFRKSRGEWQAIGGCWKGRCELEHKKGKFLRIKLLKATNVCGLILDTHGLVAKKDNQLAIRVRCNSGKKVKLLAASTWKMPKYAIIKDIPAEFKTFKFDLSKNPEYMSLRNVSKILIHIATAKGKFKPGDYIDFEFIELTSGKSTSQNNIVSKLKNISTLKVLHSAYESDPAKICRRGYTGSYIHIYLKNKSNKKVDIQKILFDGEDSAIANSFVSWNTITPNPVMPGQLAEVIIRLNLKLKESAAVTLITAKKKKLELAISPIISQNSIEFIAFSKDLKKIFIYQKSDNKPQKIYLSGRDITRQTTVHEIQKGLHIIEASLKKKMTYGAPVVLQVTDLKGQVAFASVRVWDSIFSLGICGKLSRKRAQDYAAMGINTYYDFGIQAKSNVELLANKDIAYVSQVFRDGFKKYGSYSCKAAEKLSGYPGFFAYFLKDEPDACEYHAKLRLGAYARGLAKARDFCLQTDPHHLVLNVIDTTHTPTNYFTYGRMADLMVIDPYVIMNVTKRNGKNELMFPLDKIDYALKAAKPHPVFTDLYICAGKQNGGRFPTTDELKTLALYAAGSGSKGIWYFSYDAGRQGSCSDNPALITAIKNINSVLSKTGDIFARGCKADLIASSSDGVWAKTIVKGREYVALVLVNKKNISDSKGLVYKPLKDVHVDLKLPGFLMPRKAFKVTHDANVSVAFRKTGNLVQVKLNELKTGTVIVFSTTGKMPPVEKSLLINAKPVASSNNDIDSNKPVLVYNFNQAGEYLKDSSPYDNSAIIRKAEWVKSKDVAALAFAKAGKSYTECLDSSSISPNKALSIIMWVKVPAQNGGGRVLAKAQAYALNIWGGHPVVQVRLQEDLKQKHKYWSLRGTRKLTPERWYCIAATFNSKTKKLALYVNGVLNKQLTRKTSGPCLLNGGDGQHLQIGGSTSYGGYSNSQIGYVALYRKALDAQEIKAIYDQSQNKYK